MSNPSTIWWLSMQRCEKCGAYINRVGGCPNCGLPLVPVMQSVKVRRRVEDFLRKCSDEVIMDIAKQLGVKLT